METKVCKHCGKELPLSSFGLDKSKKDGHKDWCRECTNERQRENMRKLRERTKQAKLIREVPTEGNPALKDFTPRQLMLELYMRGYRGSLTFTKSIDISKLND